MSAKYTQGLLRVKISAVLGDAWLMPAGANEVNRVREVALVNEPEDARRLAACWNMADGVDTNSIDEVAKRGGMLAVNKSIEGLESELTGLRATIANQRMILAHLAIELRSQGDTSIPAQIDAFLMAAMKGDAA